MKILTDIVTELLYDAVEKSFPGEIDINDLAVQFTKDIQLGHMQSNIALISSKKLRKNPREVATQIVNTLSINNIIEKAEIAGPGFINFFLKADLLNNYLTNFNPNSWDYDIEIEKV